MDFLALREELDSKGILVPQALPAQKDLRVKRETLGPLAPLGTLEQ